MYKFVLILVRSMTHVGIQEQCSTFGIDKDK